jgi:pimeloyl-ACP methyl ester carboxylesterase
MDTLGGVSLAHHFIPINGIRLHIVEAGPPDGLPVVLLHGFPEFWYGWRSQIPALAQAGYRVIAPDQRGYNLSDKPRGVASYALDRLVDDVVGLIDTLGIDRVGLVGHDWGGAVSWWTALRHPHRLSRMAILNMPHPLVMSEHARRSLSQMHRSWYILAFQLPWLPEMLLRRRDYRAGQAILAGTAKPDIVGPADLAQYREAWSQPGALTAMLNWYRAALRLPPGRLEAGPRVRVPTLLIWGRHDVALGHEMAQPSLDLCDEGRLVTLDAATHWVQHDQPGQVNALLAGWLAGKP